jgi:hypothetical protein
MVAVHGVNPTGRSLVAHSVCTSLPAPLAPAAVGGCCMVAAAGPFTTNDCLSFAPLAQLLQHCEGAMDARHDAQLVLLLHAPLGREGQRTVKRTLCWCAVLAIAAPHNRAGWSWLAAFHTPGSSYVCYCCCSML